jgi:hypothetical protein
LNETVGIRWGSVEMYIDLGAERVIGAERNGEKIAVKVKSFLGQATVYEFHLALGQFINYRAVLQQQEADRILYLAIPLDTFDTFFNLPFTQAVVQQNQMKLLVYDVDQEVIVIWQT